MLNRRDFLKNATAFGAIAATGLCEMQWWSAGG